MRWLCAAFAWLLLALGSAAGQAATPLLLPEALAYDSQGNLYFAEAGRHVVERLSPGGVVQIVAGTGVQGFGGDGGPATAAQLDAPGALALDAIGDLFIADTHNHRIRRVDAATGTITTFAGNGVAGLGTDGVLVTTAALDLPTALAFDASGNLYYADGARQVIRRIDHATLVVTTVAGNGVQGTQGDGGAARAASLDSPGGLAIDAAGNVFISDSHNHKVRRVDAATGNISSVAGPAQGLQLPRGLTLDAGGALYIVDMSAQQLRRVDSISGVVTTVAGAGPQGFAGDGGPAVAATLSSPGSVALSPGGLPTFADTANGRVRQVDAAGIIQTIAGQGAVTPAGLTLSGPASVIYGSGIVTASLGGSAGTGAVTLLEGSRVVVTGALAANRAALSLASLPAGSHSLTASFSGDTAHGASLSNTLTVVATQAPVLATPTSVTQVYGLAIPALMGTSSGVLAQDSGAVQVYFSSGAGVLAGVGSYTISASLTGAAAANYSLTTSPGSVTITKAASTLSLTNTLLAHVGSTTAGQPGGTLVLADGAAPYATAPVSPVGDAQFSATALSNGSHTLSASYAGDSNFLASASPPVTVTVGPVAAADFSLAGTSAAAVTASAGSDAVYSFAVSPVNGALSSPVQLAVSGLPTGATASFSPAYLPPGSLPASFTLSVHTLKTASVAWPGGLVVAGTLLLFLLPRRRRKVWLACAVVGLAGCGDRVNNFGQGGGTSRTYNLTINATATSNAGAVLLHSTTVSLTIQ